ncbi:hypothetical protein JTE90_018651, partial [Oedothorax gibbosus]
ESQHKLVCYFDASAYSRKGDGKFDMFGFLPNLCTHAIYGIARLEHNAIVSSEPSRDLPDGLKGYEIFNDLKLRNPNLKTLIGIGGWEDMGSEPYSFMAADPVNRTYFISSVVTFLRKYGFDGIDINWAYPANNGGRPEDKQNFIILLRELKTALAPRGRLVTTTVSAAGSWNGLVIELAYDIPQIAEVLDQVHLLSFDFHGYWDDYTGLNAPLYAPPDASDIDRLASVDFAVNYWLERGMPKEKLIMSLPFYGRMYTLANASDNDIGSTATEVGKPGHLNGNDEELGFNEVCDNLMKKRWASVWDSDSQTPYAYKDDQWVSYDDQRSLNIKVDYLIKKGLAGALVRSIDTDDHKEINNSRAQFSSSCGKKHKVNILLDTANDFIRRAKDSNPTCSFGSPDSHYTAYSSESVKTSALLGSATSLISAAKNVYSSKSHGAKYKLVCYFTSWAFQRKGEGRFDLSGFQPHLCTHAIYALAKLENNSIESRLPDIDLPEYLNGYQKFNDLKKKNPNLKTLIAIGGWDMTSKPFSIMASDRTNRTIFIESVLLFLKQHGFNGLDLDWEWPVTNGGRAEDKQNFVVLLKELKAALHSEGFLLTSTVSATKYYIDMAYDIPAISKELDQIHLLSFNFHGHWDPVIGLNAPLYAAQGASDQDKQLTVDFAVDYWLKGGAPKEKLILGMPLFGRSFTLANPNENGVHAQAAGSGESGRLNGDREILGFNEICENLSKRRWASVWDPDAWTPYAYKGNQWVGYDNQRSLNLKVEYLMKKGLAGGLVWSIDTDDHRGECYGKKYYLLNFVSSKLLS